MMIPKRKKMKYNQNKTDTTKKRNIEVKNKTRYKINVLI